MSNANKIKVYKDTKKIYVDKEELDYYLKCGWKVVQEIKATPTYSALK